MRTYVRVGLLLTAVLALAVLAGGTPAYAWSYPAALNTNAATDSGLDWLPQVTTDGLGNWLAVWHSNDELCAPLPPGCEGSLGTDSDILVARSTDNGATWTDPAALNTNAATDSGDDTRPQVTTDGQAPPWTHWVAVWESNGNLGGAIGTDYDILVARSGDNGATWTAPVPLNTNAATDSGDDARPQVTTNGTYGGNNWVAVWHSNDSLGGTIGTDRDILVAGSTDNGVTWTAPAALNTNAAGDSGDDWDPQVTTDRLTPPWTHWVAVWESNDELCAPLPPGCEGSLGTDYDILVARSGDNGANWTAPAALNRNAATDSGDDYVPQVTTGGWDNWVAVWVSDDELCAPLPPGCEGSLGTDRDILVARSTDKGATWPPPPVPLNSNATTDSGDDDWPQVTTDGGGNWVAVWHSNENLGGTIGTDLDILVARSTNNGVTWTAPPVPLNTNAATDSGSDFLPQVTTDGAGNWVAVWYSYDDLGGTIGTDFDILYATEYIPPYPPVGGLAELPDASDSAGRNYVALAALAALAAAALVALSAGGWYVRRRWVR